MKINSWAIAFICLSCILSACNSVTPQKYFSVAVLNTNQLYGFAGSGLEREIASPSVKLINQETGATAAMKRAEVVADKLAAVESNYSKVKSLSDDADAAAIKQASIQLYEFVLPVYKNEYKELAVLYDKAAPATEITAMEKNISDKYAARFEELYNTLHAAGMAYAAKNNIKVMEVNPSPAY